MDLTSVVYLVSVIWTVGSWSEDNDTKCNAPVHGAKRTVRSDTHRIDSGHVDEVVV